MSEKNLKQLISLWLQEKEQYKTTEIGTGVQKFVKHIFECKELFNLEEGKLSTAELKRKNEFLTEAKKKGRRADVVIFIDADIVIPVEIEKNTQIKSGINQIYNYQGDWTKKLGLLTDGNEWWFYNNRFVEKKFFIKDIFENPTNFLTYWKEYITPDYYYRSFFEKKGQLEIYEIPAPKVDDVREDFFIDITKLIENFENKLNLKGYFITESNETERKKKAVEITYAYLIQFVLYKVLVDNAFGDLDNDWTDRLKSIDKAIKAESYTGVLVLIKGISDKISEKIYKRFNDEQLMINYKLKEILSAPKSNISDVSVWLDILLFINRYDFSNVQNEIFGYVYENYLKDLYLDEKKGQYFTDPHIVEFMLKEMGYTKENLQKRYAEDNDSLSIIDPSCGSGTFLYNATNRIVEAFFDESQSSSKLTEQLINNNIFGLDIAEFPLYLAEMNILMRMLPIIINQEYNNPVDKKIKVFKTRDSIAEFLDTNLKNTLTDINIEIKKNKGQISFDFAEVLSSGYTSFHRNKNDLKELKDSVENNPDNKKISRYRFDYVIGNPPYVAYNEISQQKLLFVQLMQSKKLQMSDIYGVNLNTVPGRIKAYSPKPNLYSFFIALGLALLKDGGKLCYIIPQTILTAADLDVIRYHLASFARIDKIINFSCKMFIGRGIKQNKPVPTSSLILIVSKMPAPKLHETEIIYYEDPNDDVVDCLANIEKGKKIIKTKILQNKLRQNIENWNFIKSSKEEKGLIDEYYKSTESMDIYREYVYSKKYFDDIFIIDGSYNIPKKSILYDNPKDKEYYDIPIFDSNFYSIRKYGYYPKDVEIKIAKGGQGLKVVATRHKVLWNYIKPQRFFYISDNNNILPKFQQFCIGSNKKEEITYLFSLLNNPITFFLFEKYLRSENEKDILVGVKFIKEFIRVPKINSYNEHIKKEVISSTIELLEMEKVTIVDLVDFGGIMLQKFETIDVVENTLSIRYKDKEAKCNITGKIDLVKNTISNLKKRELLNDEGIGNVSELKLLSAFDKEYQAHLKNYIDDLVYALYFKINLPDIGFNKAKEIKEVCAQHKYNKLVNSKS